MVSLERGHGFNTQSANEMVNGLYRFLKTIKIWKGLKSREVSRDFLFFCPILTGACFQ